MTTLMRRGFASSFLGAFALVLAGCGGGGGGVSTPTATPIGTPSGTVTPTATTVPGTGGTPVTANQLAFVSNRANPNSSTGATDLYKSSTDGSSVVRLTSQNQTIDKPSVSSDGGRLAFQIGDSNSNGGTNNIEIALINANGSGFVQLTNDSTPAGRPDDYNPVFSPNGQYIYWTSTRRGVNEAGQTVDGTPHIWRMDGAVGNTGNNQQQVVSEASAYPSLDRNGNMAYVALNQTSSPIAILNIASGTVTKRLGGNVTASQVFDIALSPDGNRLAFSAGSGTGSASAATINVYNVGTSAREASMPTGGTSNGGSAWSRDSQTLYFDSANGSASRRQIFASGFPFSTQRAISTDSTSDNYSPAFLPVS